MWTLWCVNPKVMPRARLWARPRSERATCRRSGERPPTAAEAACRAHPQWTRYPAAAEGAPCCPAALCETVPPQSCRPSFSQTTKVDFPHVFFLPGKDIPQTKPDNIRDKGLNRSGDACFPGSVSRLVTERPEGPLPLAGYVTSASQLSTPL